MKSKLMGHLVDAYERDRRWIMQFDVVTMDKFLWPLLVAFICLNFLDVYSTILAMTYGPLFHEQNPLASMLFSQKFQGYLTALVFKYLPLVPMFYIVFATDKSGRHEVQIRLVKFTAVVALTGANILLFYVVGIHNLQSLL